MMNPNDDRSNVGTLPSANVRDPYKFSPDELRVLKDCNRDSFFQRCVPLGTLFGVATYYGVHTGYFRGHPKYGATPKVAISVIFGYFIGKFSYQRICADRLMQLPNSAIGEMLRQKRKGNFRETMEPGFGPGMALAPFSSIGTGDTYSDVEPKNNSDIDTTRPDFEGLNDSHRPSVDNPIYEEEMPPQHKSTTSYEELRQKNRDEYQQKRTTNYRSPTPTSPTNVVINEPIDEPRSPSSRTNIYGDPIV